MNGKGDPPDFTNWPLSRIKFLLKEYRGYLQCKMTRAQRATFSFWVRQLQKEADRRD